MSQMSEAAKQRMKDFVSASTKVALDTCEAHGYPTYDEKLCILADEISEASYKAGMQDPDAGASISESDVLEAVTQWKHFWMNQTQNSEADRKNYFDRAFQVDSNMKHDLARRIVQKIREARK